MQEKESTSKENALFKITLITQIDRAYFHQESKHTLLKHPNINTENLIHALTKELEKFKQYKHRTVKLKLTKAELKQWLKKSEPYILTVAEKDLPNTTYRWRIQYERDDNAV